MCFSLSFRPQPRLQRLGTAVAQSTGVASGGAGAEQGPQPRAEDGGDGVGAALKPPPVPGAFAGCVHVAVRGEGLAGAGLRRLPAAGRWALHPQQPPLKAAGTRAGAPGEALAAPLAPCPGIRSCVLPTRCSCYLGVGSGDAKPFLGREAAFLALPHGGSWGWEPAGALAAPGWRAEVRCQPLTAELGGCAAEAAPAGSHCCCLNHPPAGPSEPARPLCLPRLLLSPRSGQGLAPLRTLQGEVEETAPSPLRKGWCRRSQVSGGHRCERHCCTAL